MHEYEDREFANVSKEDLKLAEDKKEKNREYYYFLVANAYYNMGREGNSWMMRRFGGWSHYWLSDFEDEVEFRQCNLAKQYYQLAGDFSQSQKFKALCLRMMLRCEKFKLEYKYIQDGNGLNYNYDSLMASNHYITDLKNKYPDYFEDLISNCDNFSSYFEAGK